MKKYMDIINRVKETFQLKNDHYISEGADSMVYDSGDGRSVIKLTKMTPTMLRFQRMLARQNGHPIAKIYDIRVMGLLSWNGIDVDVNDNHYCQYYRRGKQLIVLVLQEKLKAWGASRPPTTWFHEDGTKWVQEDTHDGNHIDGKWVDTTRIHPESLSTQERKIMLTEGSEAFQPRIG